ncbi:MAG: NADH-quinone oxidoreductase subunit NuoG [Gammaproteobacteria bacterium]
MSAPEDVVRFEVNGVPVEARMGAMVIQATDAAGIYVPRFCYHEKLTIAANCRMCLVEVEKAPKPLPACATPVAEGMKVFTRSEKAIAAQRAVMEFLLINHPLDCPICDQGGECELQDLAMGFGRDVSRFTEKKRIIKDQNIGPLVSTDMTRCIHCTRCVRFGQEIAGIQELGTTGRTENMRIEVYIGRSVDHELSGNIIDLCPVGALNNKPYRYSARAWEMLERPAIGMHDCVGSNLFAHTLRGRLKRVVPRENEAVNETWIADRDRYSCHGIYSEDRLEQPLVKIEGRWREASWEIALEAAAAGIRSALETQGPAQFGALAAPGSTLEEFFLLNRIVRGAGSNNIDHRLRRADFRDQDQDPVFPSLGTSIAGLAKLDALLVVGSNLRREAPMLAHRVRQAAMRGGRIMFLNPAAYDFLFPVANYRSCEPAGMLVGLAQVLGAAAQNSGRTLPDGLADVVRQAGKPDVGQTEARHLLDAANGLVLLGHLSQRHPQFADLRAVAAALAELCGVSFGYIADGGNSVGGHLAGALPHRDTGGRPVGAPGLTVTEMLAQPLKAMLLFGLEPEADCRGGPEALGALEAAGFVVACHPYVTAEMRRYADVILPTGTFAETSGTHVNCEGRWQSFDAAAAPVGASRPGWKVLRVLGNAVGIEGFDYRSSQQAREELRQAIGRIEPDNRFAGKRTIEPGSAGAIEISDLDLPMYSVDAVVRRSRPLQLTREAHRASNEADVSTAARG